MLGERSVELPLSEVTEVPDSADVEVIKVWLNVGLKRGHKSSAHGKPKNRPEEEPIAPVMELGHISVCYKTFFYIM